MRHLQPCFITCEDVFPKDGDQGLEHWPLGMVICPLKQVHHYPAPLFKSFFNEEVSTQKMNVLSHINKILPFTSQQGAICTVLWILCFFTIHQLCVHSCTLFNILSCQQCTAVSEYISVLVYMLTIPSDGIN